MGPIAGAPLALLLAAAAPQPASEPPFAPVVFREVAAERGVRFSANTCRTARKHQPETMVAGVALLDYNGDGWLDIYVVNGATMPGLEKTGPEYWNRLYRNNGDGTFTDVTAAAGLAGRGYDLGVATGDYDNDGDTDIFVAGLRRNTL
jgi:enediyne biosynthesis protein E4